MPLRRANREKKRNMEKHTRAVWVVLFIMIVHYFTTTTGYTITFSSFTSPNCTGSCVAIPEETEVCVPMSGESRTFSFTDDVVKIWYVLIFFSIFFFFFSLSFYFFCGLHPASVILQYRVFFFFFSLLHPILVLIPSFIFLLLSSRDLLFSFL
jgi:hypothetical protein